MEKGNLMIRTRATTALLALGLLCGAGLASAQYYQGPQGPPPQAWEAPPPQFVEAQQRGYHDGVEGARKMCIRDSCTTSPSPPGNAPRTPAYKLKSAGKSYGL